MSLSPDVIFVIHQIGTGADGGIQSISEILFSTPQLNKLIVTNLSTKASARWEQHGKVEIWSMGEAQHSDHNRGLRYRAGQIYSRVLNNIKMAWLVRRQGVRVVHCNDHRSFWNSVFGAKLAGARVILNVRDTMRPGARSHFMWRMALRLCDRFLVLSQEMIDSWKDSLKPVSLASAQSIKFDFLYSIVDPQTCFSVDSSRRIELREGLRISDSQMAIAYVGRVEPKKAQLPFIGRVIPKVVESVPDAHIYIVGDYNPDIDPYAARCRDEVAKQGVSSATTFVGYSPRVADWYRACDLLVLASEREGLPRCVIEGLACGVPVVSFDVCSVREILEEHHCGYVVSQGDYDGLADIMRHVLQSPAERERLHIVGPKVANSLFRADVNARIYMDMVRKLSVGRVSS